MVKHNDTTHASRVRDVPQELLDRGREMVGLGRDVWLAGLGALAVVGEEGTHLFDRLVESGEDLEKRGKKQFGDRQTELRRALDENVTDPVMTTLRRLGVPSRAEMHTLTLKVDRLTRKVEKLVAHVSGEPMADEDGERMTLKVYKVVAAPEGWTVSHDGDADPVAVLPTKEEALEEARAMAREDAPSRLDVYRKDGTLQDTFTF